MFSQGASELGKRQDFKKGFVHNRYVLYKTGTISLLKCRLHKALTHQLKN